MRAAGCNTPQFSARHPDFLHFTSALRASRLCNAIGASSSIASHMRLRCPPARRMQTFPTKSCPHVCSTRLLRKKSYAQRDIYPSALQHLQEISRLSATMDKYRDGREDIRHERVQDGSPGNCPSFLSSLRYWSWLHECSIFVCWRASS